MKNVMSETHCLPFLTGEEGWEWSAWLDGTLKVQSLNKSFLRCLNATIPLIAESTSSENTSEQNSWQSFLRQLHD